MHSDESVFLMTATLVVSSGAGEWRKKKRYTGTRSAPHTKRVPSYLNTQVKDPAFIKINKISDSCVNGICAENVESRVACYHDGMISYFRRYGVSIIRRMLTTKKFCEIVLQEHSRLCGFVSRACQNLDSLDHIMNSLKEVSECYPTSAKHRNAPSAMRKMQHLECEQNEIDRQDRLKRKREIEASGGCVVEWTDDEDEY